MPSTERQLTTPTRLWALGKGGVLGCFGTAWMLISHVCVSLLTVSFGWPLSLRIGLLTLLFAGTIYGMNNFLLNKLIFATGAAALLKKLVMLGFVGHIFIVKFATCMIVWLMEILHVDMGLTIYHRAEWLYPFYANWIYPLYLQIKMPPGVEWILFGAVVAGYILSSIRSKDVFSAMRQIQAGSRPYDLLSSGS